MRFWITLALVQQMLHRALRLDAAARLRAYAGEVLVFRQLPAAKELCERFRSLRSDLESLGLPTFDCDASETAFEDRERLCRAFERDKEVQALYGRMFDEAGVDPKATCWDRPRLRVQQSGSGVDDVANSAKFGTGKFSSTLPPHRDTWASNIYQQLQWWMPLCRIDAGRTVCFYPDLFEREVPNGSGDWDFDALRERRKLGLPYPQLPELRAEAESVLRASEAVPVVVDPGDVVIFSGAHLHASVVNTTGVTRYSAEIRSVSVDDVRAGLGAPNVDGRAPRVPLHWFKRVEDKRSLADLVDAAVEQKG